MHMYELDNRGNSKNRFILEDFLFKNYSPLHLQWDDENMKFIVLIESDNIVGVSAVRPYKKNKVHLCVMAVVPQKRKIGYGTKMLRHLAVMYPNKEITAAVEFSRCDVLGFYLRYAHMTGIDTDRNTFLLKLNNLKLLADVPLPD